MVLFAIVGELGSGKTLALSYLAWNNWFKKHRKIFSNYNFYGFPFTLIKTIPELDKMKTGFFAGDELWLWLDSRTTKKDRNRIVSNILLKSRKREITIAYTTQSIHQVDKRIRDVTDFVAYPLMSVDNSYCRLEIFRGPRPSVATRIKPPLYFMCENVYAIFNTYEEIAIINEENKNDPIIEIFFPIITNPAWIRYLKKEKKVKTPDKIESVSESIMKEINPENVKSTPSEWIEEI